MSISAATIQILKIYSRCTGKKIDEKQKRILLNSLDIVAKDVFDNYVSPTNPGRLAKGVSFASFAEAYRNDMMSIQVEQETVPWSVLCIGLLDKDTVETWIEEIVSQSVFTNLLRLRPQQQQQQPRQDRHGIFGILQYFKSISEAELELEPEPKLEPALFTIDENDLKIGKQIGSGGSGVVCQAQRERRIGCPEEKIIDTVAVKFIQLDYDYDAKSFVSLTKLENEILLAMKMFHDNVVRTHGAVLITKRDDGQRLIPPRVGIVSEYCPHGHMDPRDIFKLNYIIGAARGCKYLHENDVAHRDIKLENILIGLDGSGEAIAKIADFGHSILKQRGDKKSVGSQGENDDTQVGTPGHIPPEVRRGGVYDQKGDVYCFGRMIRSPQLYQELATRCMQENPDNRPTFDVVVRTLEELATLHNRNVEASNDMDTAVDI